jgi:hypothetical protein
MLYGFIVHIPTVLYNRPINIVTLLLTFEPKDLANNYVIKEKNQMRDQTLPEPPQVEYIHRPTHAHTHKVCCIINEKEREKKVAGVATG